VMERTDKTAGHALQMVNGCSLIEAWMVVSRPLARSVDSLPIRELLRCGWENDQWPRMHFF
jgi:hypothetical protein